MLPYLPLHTPQNCKSLFLDAHSNPLCCHPKEIRAARQGPIRSTIALGMTFFQIWLPAIPHLLPAFGLTMAFALCAWGLRAITAAAALTGVLLTFVLCLAAGPGALFPVFVVFLLTLFSTRIGRRKKERLGTGERRHGRGSLQILANIGASALCAAPLLATGHARAILLAGASAALAEAAGDTVSSELGQALGGIPRLVTTLRRVSPGQDGGITTAGTVFSLIAIYIVCAASVWSGLLLPRYYWTVFAAAFFGTIVDSLLGATLERPGRLGNNSVNFSSTVFAAALSIAVLFAQRWM
jgi:uncharacterized protein (TIGR00297 family)